MRPCRLHLPLLLASLSPIRSAPTAVAPLSNTYLPLRDCRTIFHLKTPGQLLLYYSVSQVALRLKVNVLLRDAKRLTLG